MMIDERKILAQMERKQAEFRQISGAIRAVLEEMMTRDDVSEMVDSARAYLQNTPVPPTVANARALGVATTALTATHLAVTKMLLDTAGMTPDQAIAVVTLAVKTMMASIGDTSRITETMGVPADLTRAVLSDEPKRRTN